MTTKTIVQLPTADVMYTTLRGVSDIGGDIDRHFRQFANSIGGKDRYAAGVCMAWVMSVTELTQREGATPFLAGILDMRFEDCMTVLFADNPDFAAEVIAVYREVSPQ